MSFLNSCDNQRDQRKSFFFFEGANNVRFNMVSPYTYDSSGQLVYTQDQLNMRRKSEILKYIQPHKNNVKKNKYADLVQRNNKQVSRTACNNTNIPIPTSSSDVPGPVIYLQEDPTVPLYKYYAENEQFQFQNIPYDDFKRIFDNFIEYNILMKTLENVSFNNIIILKPPGNQLSFNFSLPVNLQVSGTYTSSNDVNAVNTVNISVYSARLEIYYSNTLVQAVDSTYRSSPAIDTDIASSTNTVSILLNNSSSGLFSASQYVGNLLFNNIILPSVTQYVYNCVLKIGINYSEYGNIGLVRSNSDGNDIGSTDETNVTDVEFNPFLNIDSETNSEYSTNTNCEITMFTNKIITPAQEASGVSPEVTNIIFIPTSISI